MFSDKPDNWIQLDTWHIVSMVSKAGYNQQGWKSFYPCPVNSHDMVHWLTAYFQHKPWRCKKLECFVKITLKIPPNPFYWCLKFLSKQFMDNLWGFYLNCFMISFSSEGMQWMQELEEKVKWGAMWNFIHSMARQQQYGKRGKIFLVAVNNGWREGTV